MLKTSKPYAWFAWSSGTLLYFLSYGVIALPSVLSNDLTADLGFTAIDNGFMSASFLLSYVLFQVPFGALIDNYGYKKALLLSLLFAISGNVLLAYSSGPITAIFSRFILGVGCASFYLVALAITKDLFEAKQFPRLLAVLEAIAMSSIVIIPLLFNTLSLDYSWRTVSLMLGGIYLILWLMVSIFFKENSLYGSTQLQLLIKSMTLNCRNRTVWLLSFYAGAMYSHMSVYSNMWRIPILNDHFGLSENFAIFINSISSLGMAIGIIVFGMLVRYTPLRRLLYQCALLQLLTQLIVYICAYHFYTEISKLGLFFYYTCLFLSGFFTGAVIYSFVFLRDLVTPNNYSTASGIVNMLFGGIAIIFNPIIGIFLSSFPPSHWWVSMIIVYTITLLGFWALTQVIRLNS